MFLTIGSKLTKLAVNSTVNRHDLNMLLEVKRVTVTNVPQNTFITHFSYTDDWIWITKLNTLIKSSCTTVVNNY